MIFRHIIFDLDGTLVDSAAHCATIANDLLERRGSCRRLSRADAVPHMSYGGEHLVRSLLASDLDDLDRDLDLFRTRYAATPTPETCVFPHVREGLTDLFSRGFVLGVCSNKPQSLCEKILDDLELRPFIASIVGSRIGVPPKPDPSMLKLNLAEMKGSAPTALLVGDSEVDQALAVAAGVPFWLVTYGYAGVDVRIAADAAFDKFEDVAIALCSLIKPSAEHGA